MALMRQIYEKKNKVYYMIYLVGNIIYCIVISMLCIYKIVFEKILLEQFLMLIENQMTTYKIGLGIGVKKLYQSSILTVCESALVLTLVGYMSVTKQPHVYNYYKWYQNNEYIHARLREVTTTIQY